MSAGQLSEHRGYLTDDRKVAAYRAALAHFVTPESVVLDLGAGTGLLGLLAAECGARRVYAVDNGSIISLAETMAKASGFGDRIVHVKAMSTETTLPEPVDIVVCDQIGGFVHDAGVLGYFADARSRLMRPGGVLMPGSFDLRLSAVADPDLAGNVADWDGRGSHGFDATPFADAAANTEHYVTAQAPTRLSGDALVCSIAADHNAHFGGRVTLLVEQSGPLCGFLGTFVAHLAPGVTLSNAPWADDRFRRWQNFYPLRRAVEVEPGDVIEASIDVAPVSGVVAWRGTIRRGDETLASYRHDTLSGRFSGPESVIRASDHWVPTIGGKVREARRVAELADGTRALGAIVDQLVGEFPTSFATRDAARNFVNWALGPLVADAPTNNRTTAVESPLG